MIVDLKGKVAVVTGGARDIGAAIVRSLAASGASVVVNYAQSAERASALVGEITAAGGNAIAVQADVATTARSATGSTSSSTPPAGSSRGRSSTRWTATSGITCSR